MVPSLKMMKCMVFFLVLVSAHASFTQTPDSLLLELGHAQRPEQPAILNELSKLLRTDNLDSSKMFAIQAHRIAKDINQPEQQALASKNIGIIHWFNYELDSALAFYKESLDAYLMIGNQQEIANLYNNISIVFSKRVQNDTAIALLQKALEINLKRNDSIGIARNYVNLGVLYSEIENFQAEMHCHREGLKYARQSSDVIYSNMGGTMSVLYGSDSAIFYYRKALSVCKDNRLKARIYLNMGPHFRVLSMSDSAAMYLEKGMNLLSDTNSETYAKAKMDQAILYEYEGALKLALQTYRESNAIAEAHGYNSLILDLRAAMAGLYAKMNQWQEAYEWGQLESKLRDSLSNMENSRHLATLQSQFEFEQNQRKIGELTKENLEKEVQIAEERNFKLILLIGFTFLSMSAIILFISYRRKQEKREQNLALKSLEIEQRMLRSQMNPHFIFNALNSIQSFVTTNKAYEAEVFMSKFSMLVRKILENSTQKFISLEEEIETLRLYLELEKSRFEERFDFEIIEEADGMISIPPMLLQPFIENAIVHGMKEKKDKGIIHVRFVESDDYLQCEVEDDGVGRTKSPVDKTHKSLATSLTNERISYFNEASSEGEYNLQIVDLKDDEGKPRGTKIILKIPLVA